MQVQLMDNDYDPFFITLAEWITRRDRVMLSTAGGPKMQEARHEGFNDGRREMMCQVLAVEINRRRIETFKHWKQVPIINAIDSRKELALIEAAYDAAHELLDETKVNGAKAVNWDTFYVAVENIVNVTAVPAELMEDETKRHRQAVVEGYEEPNESDYAWLVEEQGKISDESRRLQKLVSKAAPKGTGV